MLERMNWILLDMVRSMIEFVSLSISFWNYTLETTYYILNRVPSKSVAKTPYEIWTGRRPILSYLKIWDCPTYVQCLQSDKFESSSDMCYFVRYLKETRWFYFYHTYEQKVFVSNKAFFLKKEFLEEGTNVTKVELDEV